MVMAFFISPATQTSWRKLPRRMTFRFSSQSRRKVHPA